MKTTIEVEALRESCPDPELIRDPAELKRQRRIPLMLFLACRRLERRG